MRVRTKKRGSRIIRRKRRQSGEGKRNEKNLEGRGGRRGRMTEGEEQGMNRRTRRRTWNRRQTDR